MSRSVAQHAVQPESRIPLEAAAMETEAPGQPRVRCSPQNAPRAGKILRYLLNPVVIDRSIVQIVTAKQIRQKDTNSPAGK